MLRHIEYLVPDCRFSNIQSRTYYCSSHMGKERRQLFPGNIRIVRDRMRYSLRQSQEHRRHKLPVYPEVYDTDAASAGRISTHIGRSAHAGRPCPYQETAEGSLVTVSRPC